MTAITDCLDGVLATNGDIDEETKESHRFKTRLVRSGPHRFSSTPAADGSHNVVAKGRGEKSGVQLGA